jgi:hypothetical protein
MHRVALLNKQLGQVRAVLAGDSRDQRHLPRGPRPSRPGQSAARSTRTRCTASEDRDRYACACVSVCTTMHARRTLRSSLGSLTGGSACAMLARIWMILSCRFFLFFPVHAAVIPRYHSRPRAGRAAAHPTTAGGQWMHASEGAGLPAPPPVCASGAGGAPQGSY